MSQGKSVRLSSGHCFATKAEATAFYRSILNREPPISLVCDADYSMVDALFRDYCVLKGRSTPGEPVRYFRNWNGAEGRATISFFVVFDNGEIDDFSYLKAINVVANRGEPF